LYSGESRIKVKTDMKNLRLKCPYCGCWNHMPVNKIVIEQNTFDSEVKAYIRVYEPLEVVKCKKRGEVIAEPEELIRIVKEKMS